MEMVNIIENKPTYLVKQKEMGKEKQGGSCWESFLGNKMCWEVGKAQSCEVNEWFLIVSTFQHVLAKSRALVF